MNEEEIKLFWHYVSLAPVMHPDWRKGQAMMNALRVVAPPLYDEASGSIGLDCFYDDGKVGALRDWLGI